MSNWQGSAWTKCHPVIASKHGRDSFCSFQRAGRAYDVSCPFIRKESGWWLGKREHGMIPFDYSPAWDRSTLYWSKWNVPIINKSICIDAASLTEASVILMGSTIAHLDVPYILNLNYRTHQILVYLIRLFLGSTSVGPVLVSSRTIVTWMKSSIFLVAITFHHESIARWISV